MNETIITVIAAAAALLAGFGIGIFIGIMIRKRIAEKKIGSAEEAAKKIEADAKMAATYETNRMIVAAQKEINQQRSESEREIKDRRAEVARSERRLASKEETLDRKTEQLDRKNEILDRKIRENDAAREEVNAAIAEQQKKLEAIAGLTTEEAKSELMASLESEAKYDFAQRMDELEAQFKEEADTKARNLISLAIQRCAADQVAESTVTAVPLPSEDMKGRIIGREGRNIQKLETLTGVELIIDDTPEAITLSGFDPVRREVARIALEKLIADGRIHPARIEEMVEKAKREVDNQIREAGEQAIFETNMHGIHHELVKLLGRMRYRTSYGQNVLQHSIEVSHLAGLMAAELGADVQLAKRAGLLHDIGKAVDHEMEGTHVELGVEMAKRYHESPEVIHCIAAHHNDIEPQTVEAVLIQAADAISAARPGARRESIENYIRRLEKLEEISNSFPGVEKSFAIQSGREVRIMVKPEDISDEGTYVLAREVAKRIENELEYPGQIKVNVIRETRCTEFAK